MLSCREFIETLKYSSSQNLLREIVRSAGLKRFCKLHVKKHITMSQRLTLAEEPGLTGKTSQTQVDTENSMERSRYIATRNGIICESLNTQIS